MYCSNCGTKVESEERYCPECGAPQEMIAQHKIEMKVKDNYKEIPIINKKSKTETKKNKHNSPKVFRQISVALIIILAISATVKLIPFGGSSNRKSTESQSLTVTMEEPKVTLSGIDVDVNFLNLTDGDKELKVEKFKENLGDDGFVGIEYDISLGDQSYLRAPLQITLPYDKNRDKEFIPTILHYDKDFNEWIPLEIQIDEVKGTVTSKLTSLSPVRMVYFNKDYSRALYYIENSGKNNATMRVSYNYWDHIKNTSSEPASIVAQDYILQGNTQSSTEQMIKAGNDAINTVNTYYTLLGALGDTVLSSISLLAPLGGAVQHMTGTLSKGVGVVSLLIAGSQLMYDLGTKDSTGPQNETAINLYKNLATNAGTLYSFCTGYSSAAFSLGFFAVAVTGYALDTMIEEAKTIQANTVEAIFTTYYKDYSTFSEKDWYNIFVDAYWDAWQNNHESEEGMNYAIEKVTEAIDIHAEKFWTEIYKDGTDALTFAVAEAGQKNYFTPKKEQKAELTANFKRDLFTRFNKKTMPWINEFMQERVKDGVYNALLSAVEPLNQYYSVQIQEIAPQDSGEGCIYQMCPIRFGNKEGFITTPAPKEWEIAAPEDDDEWAVKRDFTMLGYIMAGSPSKVLIFDAKDKKPQFGKQIREELLVLNPIEDGGVTLIDLSAKTSVESLWFYNDSVSFDELRKTKSENEFFDQAIYALYEAGSIALDKQGNFSLSGTGPECIVNSGDESSESSSTFIRGPLNISIKGQIDLSKLKQALDEKSGSSFFIGTGTYSHEGQGSNEYKFSRGNYEKAEFNEKASCDLNITYYHDDKSIIISSKDYFDVTLIGTYTTSYDGDVNISEYNEAEGSIIRYTFTLD